MGEWHTVKLAQRLALLRLNNECCNVKLKGWGGTFTTGGKLIEMNGMTYTKIIELNELYNIKQITHIEIGNRFNEDIKIMMEVAWEE